MGVWSEMVPSSGATYLSDKVAYLWGRCTSEEPDHEHTIDCLWIFHYCDQILGPESVDPGAKFGWRLAGISLHTLVTQDPLTVIASLHWPECCGLHGFITDGKWIDA